jgi:hypothetical protein
MQGVGEAAVHPHVLHTHTCTTMVHWIFGLDLDWAWHELRGQQHGSNGKGNNGSNTMEFSFQTVGGKGKDRMHKVIIDSTHHLVVVMANAY